MGLRQNLYKTSLGFGEKIEKEKAHFKADASLSVSMTYVCDFQTICHPDDRKGLI